MEAPAETKKFRSLDRFLIHKLNTHVFQGKDDLIMKPKLYKGPEDRFFTDQEKDGTEPHYPEFKEKLEKLIKWDMNHPDLCDKPVKMPYSKHKLPEGPGIERTLEIMFNAENEARCCDEVTFVISQLQTQLDRTKIENHNNLTQLATKIEQILAWENANMFKHSSGILDGNTYQSISKIKL